MKKVSIIIECTETSYQIVKERIGFAIVADYIKTIFGDGFVSGKILVSGDEKDDDSMHARIDDKRD